MRLSGVVEGQLSAGRSMALSKHCKLWKPIVNALVQSPFTSRRVVLASRCASARHLHAFYTN